MKMKIEIEIIIVVHDVPSGDPYGLSRVLYINRRDSLINILEYSMWKQRC